jgi:hypothetical protein
MFPLLVATEVPGVDESPVAVSAGKGKLVLGKVDAAVFRALALSIKKTRTISFAAGIAILDARVTLAP